MQYQVFQTLKLDITVRFVYTGNFQPSSYYVFKRRGNYETNNEMTRLELNNRLRNFTVFASFSLDDKIYVLHSISNQTYDKCSTVRSKTVYTKKYKIYPK